MARMYFGFRTDLKDTEEDKSSPQVENISFLAKNGSVIRIGCDGESDWKIENKVFSARFKGLEYCIEDKDGNTVLDYGEEPTDEQLELLEEAVPVKVLIYIPSDNKDYPEDFIPKCKNMDISIEHNTEKKSYLYNFHVDNMETEVCGD